MIRSGIAKFLLGFILAIALIVGGGVATALYFINKSSTPPPKPIFANDKPTLNAQGSAKGTSKNTSSPTKAASSKPLEPGAYKARVTLSEGLSLRSEPNSDASRVGSLDRNQQIVVLSESADKNWQRVRTEDSEREGWIKSGNIERVEKQQ